jgi:hypothetical protein
MKREDIAAYYELAMQVEQFWAAKILVTLALPLLSMMQRPLRVTSCCHTKFTGSFYLAQCLLLVRTALALPNQGGRLFHSIYYSMEHCLELLSVVLRHSSTGPTRG